MNNEINISDNDVLKTLAEGLVDNSPVEYGADIKEENVKSILDNQNISFEQKKEIFEKVYILKLYYNAYIGADPRGKMRVLYDAKKVFDIKDSNDFNEKIVLLDMAIDRFKQASLKPFETTKKEMIDKIEIENKGIRF